MSPEYKKGYPNCERTGKYYVGIAQNGHCLCNSLLDDGMYKVHPDCSDGNASSGENAGVYQYKVFNDGIPPPGLYTCNANRAHSHRRLICIQGWRVSLK